MSTPPAAAAASVSTNHKRKVADAIAEPAVALDPKRPFAVGDRVCRTQAGHAYMPIGLLGTVTEINRSPGQTSVRWDDPVWGQMYGCYNSSMEHANPPPAKKAKTEAFAKGDRVRRTVDAGPIPTGTLGTVLGPSTYGHGDVRVKWDLDKDVDEDGWDPEYMERVTEPVAIAASSSAAAAAATEPGTIEWLEALPAQYNDVEIVQEDIASGFKCARLDLARLDTDYLNVWLKQAVEEGLTRLTLPNGTCASRNVFNTLFNVLVYWPGGHGTTSDIHEDIQILHAANWIGAFGDSQLDSFKTRMVELAGAMQPIISHVEYAEIGVLYHWKEMIATCAPHLKRQSHLKLSNAVLLACAPYWRESK